MIKLIIKLIKLWVLLLVVSIVIAAISTLLEIITKYWFILLLAAASSVAGYLFFRTKHSKNKSTTYTLTDFEEETDSLVVNSNKDLDIFLTKHSKDKSTTYTLTDFEKEADSLVVNSNKDLDIFLESNVLIRSFHTKAVGVTHNNDDGSSRQEILSVCYIGEPLGMKWYRYNGAPACALISDHGQIGHLSADLAVEIYTDYGSDEYTIAATISDITGGTDGLYYGCNVLLCIFKSTI